MTISQRIMQSAGALTGLDDLDSCTPIGVVHSKAFASVLNGSQNLVNFKALMIQRVLDNATEVKVGVVSSGSSPGRAAQAIASFAIPGDMGDIRSPIRSTVYETLTPGGGGGRRSRRGGLLGARIGRDGSGGGALRCPAGFEFGGRYTTRGFGNCGRQLFEGIGGRSGSGKFSGIGVGTDRASRRRVGDGQYSGRAVQIQRNAAIPRVAAANPKKFDEGIDGALNVLRDEKAGDLFLVRRDGQVLRAAVTGNVLSGVRNNPDMQDGALVARVTEPGSMGDGVVQNLWKGNVRQVSFGLPGGGTVTVRRANTLGTGDKRRLARIWASSTNESDGEFDYGIRLRRLVENSNGKLLYEENFPNVDKPQEMVTISDAQNEKRTASVKRWVLATYLADGAPGRNPSMKTKWREVDASTAETGVSDGKIENVEAAVKHLKDNGDPLEVPAIFLDEAIRKSRVFRLSDLRAGVNVLERADGKKWYRVNSDKDYAHLAEKVSADVNGALGLEVPPVKFIGKGSDRDFLIPHAANGGKSPSRQTVKDMPAKDLLRVVVGDWLTGQSDRNPSSVLTIGRGESARLVPTSNFQSGLAGLSTEELEARRRLTLKKFFEQSLNARAADRFANLASSQRKILIELYDDLLARATKFNWDDYVSRLGVDGAMSPGEKAHLELIKKIFERRVNQLRSARKQFLQYSNLG